VAMGNLMQESNHKVALRIQSRFQPYDLPVEAIVLDKLVGNVSSLPYDPTKRFPELRRSDMADKWPQEDGVQIDLILGQDVCWKITGTGFYELEDLDAKGLILSKTPFGIVLQGTSVYQKKQSFVLTVLANPLSLPGVRKEKKQDPKIEVMMRRFFTLEGLGISPHEDVGLTKKQAWATDYLKEHMHFDAEEKRFTVSIPFDPEAPPLVNNYSQALRRLDNLKFHLEKNPRKKEMYEKAMQAYLDSNHAEPVESGESRDKQGAFYIPHSGVLKGEGLKQKLRIVFDCSARDINGISLNETMLDAPVPEADILRILTGFRRHPYAFTADIKSCFLQIRLDRKQVDLFRFLWRKDAHTPPVVYRFTSIIFGSKCSPWISSTCIFEVLRKFEKEHPNLVEEALRSLWVDDFGFSMPTLESALRDRKLLEEMLETASFRLSKYASSHDSILEGVPEADKIFPSGEEKGVTKILGQSWHVKRDTLVCDSELIPRLKSLVSLITTKRVVAKGVASVYDPLGILGPWVITGKLLLRDIWSHQQEEALKKNENSSAKKWWDVKVPQEFSKRFEKWANQVSLVTEMEIPRCLTTTQPPVEMQMHAFCDASLHAMCCVLYLVGRYKRTTISRFICSKTRTAPLRGLTLPRAELVAALMGARLVKNVKEYFHHESNTIQAYYWTDSTVALHWLKQRADKWKTYVSNRVTEIQASSSPTDWRHVPTELNPADLGTRGVDLKELLSMKCWVEGPDFIRVGCWPKQPSVFEATTETRTEEKSSPEDALVSGAAHTTFPDVLTTLLEKHSSLYTVLRIIAWILKVKYKTEELYIFQEDLNRALGLVLLKVQCQEFKDEISYLRRKEQVPKNSSLSNLNPFLDSTGGVRVRGRVGAAVDLSYSQKHPLILPAKNVWVRWLIHHVHECNNHAGAQWCMRYLNQSYWILRARKEIRTVLNHCIVCKKVLGKKLSQMMPPLPVERTAFREPVFTYLAMDELGPLHILDDHEQPQKAYILVLACMTFRAIHLEVLKDLSYESLMLALRRTFALYGLPKVVRMDSFPTHLKVQKTFSMLEGEVSPAEIRERGRIFGIKWSWSSPYEPSTNGVIERMVGVVKKCIRQTLEKEILTYDQLNTICAEIKRTVNNRPIVDCVQDGDEHSVPICPNDLIYGHHLMSLPFETRPERDFPGKPEFQAGWDNRKRIMRKFQTAFIDQWTRTLQKLDKWTRVRDNIKEGDLVLVAHPLKKRMHWPLGIVKRVLYSRDGLARSCLLLMFNGTKKTEENRSIRSLVLLRRGALLNLTRAYGSED